MYQLGLGSPVSCSGHFYQLLSSVDILAWIGGNFLSLHPLIKSYRHLMASERGKLSFLQGLLCSFQSLPLESWMTSANDVITTHYTLDKGKGGRVNLCGSWGMEGTLIQRGSDVRLP